MATGSKSRSSRKGSTARKARKSTSVSNWGLQDIKTGSLVKGANGTIALFRNQDLARASRTDSTRMVRVNSSISR